MMTIASGFHALFNTRYFVFSGSVLGLGLVSKLDRGRLGVVT